MNLDHAELLLRLLDGELPSDERERVIALLRSDADARAFLREVAEQSVMLADIERSTAAQHPAQAEDSTERRLTVLSGESRPWRWGAMAAALALLLTIAALLVTGHRGQAIRVAKITGSTQFLGARGQAERQLTVGARLQAGDTLETLSADAWVELELPDGSKMTVAGHSSNRVLEDKTDASRLKLLYGSLWVTPSDRGTVKPLNIQTPSAFVESTRAQFDLHACSTETTLRVNDGSTTVKPSTAGNALNVRAGSQLTASLGQKELLAEAQPTPVTAWACDLWTVPEVILGRWLPADETARGRLGAEPLFWPIPNRDPLLLHAVALSVVQSSEQPVLLQRGATLTFRGRTTRPEKVRFGFSTQKMRGAFAGKFEADVPPESLGPTGKTWTVSLPLSVFRPVGPQLSSVPEGLELSDVYALTIIEDAGLELNHIELAQGEPKAAPGNTEKHLQ
jgi:ferric-dicitrate binding protein FerR (iron transport regulator)